MIVAFAVVIGRLVDVQLLEGSHLAAIGQRELADAVTLPAARGSIYDRNGQVLAMSVTRHLIVADDYLISHPRGEAATLSPVIGIPESKLAGMLHQPSGYVQLVDYASGAMSRRVEQLGLAGISILPQEERIYPNGQIGQSVLGIVGSDGSGLADLELEYNKLLEGVPGKEVVSETPAGIVLPHSRHVVQAARPGDSLVLSLDTELEIETEQALAAGVAKAKAKDGTAVIMDTKTGAILAMASVVRTSSGQVVPTMDNLAVTAVYEPGSVFKIVTFGTALDLGLITPNSTFIVPDYKIIDGAYFHDAETHPTEPMTATQIIAQSSNIGTYEIASRLGEDRLAKAIATFGFGQPTGLGFPGASPGLVRPVSEWSPTAIASTPIGQDTGVTALQIADAMNAVANGGVFVPPHLLDAIVTPGGRVQQVARPKAHRIVSAEADYALVGMLEQVVQNGTGFMAVVPGYQVAGKTGTAQIARVGSPGYIPGAYMGTWAGFAPARHPALTAVVVMNRPTPIYGGSVCAPVFAAAMRWALSHFGVPPSGGSGTVSGLQPIAGNPGGSSPETLVVPPATLRATGRLPTRGSRQPSPGGRT